MLHPPSAKSTGHCIIAAFLLILSCSNSTNSSRNTAADPTSEKPKIPVYTYRITNTYPHDPAAFTQGLLFADQIFYEGTGQYGQSSLRKVELESGNVLQKIDLPDQFFGEGIALFDERLIQLTWRSRLGFVYAKDSFEQVGQFAYATEGWGLTHDGQRLIMSDGSDYLYFRDPQTLERTDRIQVRADGIPVSRLNELEFVDGQVYANIWQTDRIARIDPNSGQVVGWIDLAGLLTPQERQRADVLNGIAYDAATKRLFVTGKWWPHLFEIELVTSEN